MSIEPKVAVSAVDTFGLYVQDNYRSSRVIIAAVSDVRIACSVIVIGRAIGVTLK